MAAAFRSELGARVFFVVLFGETKWERWECLRVVKRELRVLSAGYI